MLDAFVDACSHRPSEYVHLERLSAPALKAGDGEFIVEISRSGQEFIVPADKSVLDTLIDAGLSPKHNCCRGICGECEVKVVAGDVDHRDMLLTDGEKSAGAMLICCTRANTERLVIQLADL
ncbi:2Fe-2S iron-sulfur cluster binding domain-containing protein [Alteromonas sp. ZYF713]|nr:2Fe-2S iron-sulfur cluster binding domain-containing protein [Alteromonas sp. ZYF713]